MPGSAYPASGGPQEGFMDFGYQMIQIVQAFIVGTAEFPPHWSHQICLMIRTCTKGFLHGHTHLTGLF